MVANEQEPGPDQASDTSTSDQVAGDSLAVAKWTLASRLTGFIRVALVGAILGSERFGDLFTFVNTLPWITFELAIGALLASLVVPPLVERFDTGDIEAVSDLAGGFAGVLIAAFSAVALLVIGVSPLVARLFANSFGLEGLAYDNYLSAAVPMLIITAPQIVGYGLAFTGVAVQNAMGRFAYPASVPIVENIVVIGALILYGFVFETSTQLEEVSTGRWLLLAIGSSLGVFSHAFFQLRGAKKMGVSLRPTAGWKDPAVREILKLAKPSSGVAIFGGIRMLVLAFAASLVPGGYVAFQMALNFLNVPVALGAKPVAQAILPQLTRYEVEGDDLGWREEYQRGLGLAALIAIPAAVAIVAMARPLALGTAFGGLGTPTGRDLLTVSLIGTGLAVVGDALFQMGVPASYSRRDARNPLKAFAIRTVITTIAIGIMWALFDGVELLLGIALAVAVGDMAGGVFLDRSIARGEVRGTYSISQSLTRSFGASLIGFIPPAIAAGILVQRYNDPPVSTLIAAGFGLIGLAIYFVVRNKLGSEEIQALRNSRG